METLDATETITTTNNEDTNELLNSVLPTETVLQENEPAPVSGDIELCGDNKSESTPDATASTEFKPVKNPLLFPSESENSRKFVKKIQGLIVDNNGRGKPQKKNDDIEIEVEVDRYGHRRYRRTARPQYEPRHDVPFTTEVRSNAIHVYGTDRCSNSDLFAYFSHEYPHEIEWINDSSCNIVFKNEEFAQQALKNHEIASGKDKCSSDEASSFSRQQKMAAQPLQKKKADSSAVASGTTPTNVDSPVTLEKPLCSPPPPSPTPSSLKSEVRVEQSITQENSNSEKVSDAKVEEEEDDDDDDDDENMMDKEAEDGVRIIPWVKCVPFKAGESGITVNLQIRQATVEDVKSENRKKSLYYKRIVDEHKNDRRNFRRTSYGGPCKKIRLSDGKSYNNGGSFTTMK